MFVDARELKVTSAKESSLSKFSKYFHIAEENAKRVSSKTLDLTQM